MRNDKTLRRFKTSSGIIVYKLPVEAFPNHVTNCYLILGETIILLDAASGWESANEGLVKCFDGLADEFDEKVTLKDVDRLIITHGHVDHFGGVNFVVETSGAKLGIHALDANVIRNFRERLLVSSTSLHIFLDRSGLSDNRVQALLEMNRWSKDTFSAREIDFIIEEGEVPGTELRAYHAPGHCPGQVCLQLDDILFTADHVLSRVTPNQSPEAITRYTGLGHYLESLKKIREVQGVRIGLGGHEDEMEDLTQRIDDTIQFHEGRLGKVLDILEEPRNIAEVSQHLFGKRMDYHILLAMLETGAHVEYLYERGELIVTNIDDVEKEMNPVLVYQKR